MNQHTKSAMKRADEARNFPTNTCPASRHAQMIGENLARQKPYPMLTEEPDHCGGSILATVAALYEARSEIERLRAALTQVRGFAHVMTADNWADLRLHIERQCDVLEQKAGTEG